MLGGTLTPGGVRVWHGLPGTREHGLFCPSICFASGLARPAKESVLIGTLPPPSQTYYSIRIGGLPNRGGRGRYTPTGTCVATRSMTTFRRLLFVSLQGFNDSPDCLEGMSHTEGGSKFPPPLYFLGM